MQLCDFARLAGQGQKSFANPQDKEAADALDRALQRLKEREQKRHAPPGKDNTPAAPAKR
jgi:hypothetical protein